jgi:hypothetical protein
VFLVLVVTICPAASLTPVAYVFSRRITRAPLPLGLESLLGLGGQGPKIHTFVSGCQPGVVSGTQVGAELMGAPFAILATGVCPMIHSLMNTCQPPSSSVHSR